MRLLLAPLVALTTCGAPALPSAPAELPACPGTIVEIQGDSEFPCNPVGSQIAIRVNATYPCELQGGVEVVALNGVTLCVDVDF
jgi:hypothetical protein